MSMVSGGVYHVEGKDVNNSSSWRLTIRLGLSTGVYI